jgi:hypothetical protein
MTMLMPTGLSSFRNQTVAVQENPSALAKKKSYLQRICIYRPHESSYSPKCGSTKTYAWPEKPCAQFMETANQIGEGTAMTRRMNWQGVRFDREIS